MFDIATLIFKVITSSMPLIKTAYSKFLGKNTAFSNMSYEEKKTVIDDYIFAAIYGLYSSNGGANNHALAITAVDYASSLPIEEESSIYNLTFIAMQNSGIFKDDKNYNNYNNAQNFYSSMLLPEDYIQTKVNEYKSKVVAYDIEQQGIKLKSNLQTAVMFINVTAAIIFLIKNIRK